MTNIHTFSLTIAEVSPKTQWIFLEAGTAEGNSGAGEATLNGQEAAVVREAERQLPPLLGVSVTSKALEARGLPSSLPEAAVRSALDQAIREVEAKSDGAPVSRNLGGIHRSSVPVYANINRRTINRSPEGFAASALVALSAGHDAFKLAPFDEATPQRIRAEDLSPVLDAGFARVAAVRAAVGPNRRLMIDCHWRFDENFTKEVIRRAAELALYWVECPMPETEENMPAIRRMRALANSRGIRLAGCEQAIGLEGFKPFLDSGAYDVLMPDVKYVGGLGVFVRIAEAAASAGVEISPHNPSGPICHAMSLQVSAALPEFDRLETQFDESPYFNQLVSDGFARVCAGRETVPIGNGSGVVLDRATLSGLAAVQRRFSVSD